MTQESFAELLGVSVQYVRRIELAHTNVTVPRLVTLANALGVTVGALFDPPRSDPDEPRRGRPPKSRATKRRA